MSTTTTNADAIIVSEINTEQKNTSFFSAACIRCNSIREIRIAQNVNACHTNTERCTAAINVNLKDD